MLLALTLGVQWDAAGEMAFGARLLLNAWIAAAFAVSIATLRAVEKRVDNTSVAWALGLSTLLALGTLSDLLLQ